MQSRRAGNCSDRSRSHLRQLLPGVSSCFDNLLAKTLTHGRLFFFPPFLFLLPIFAKKKEEEKNELTRTKCMQNVQRSATKLTGHFIFFHVIKWLLSVYTVYVHWLNLDLLHVQRRDSAALGCNRCRFYSLTFDPLRSTRCHCCSLGVFPFLETK